MNKLINYIKDVRGELKHVSWPTKKQSIWFTVTVIVVSLLTAVFLGFFDFIFSLGLDNFIFDWNQKWIKEKFVKQIFTKNY